MLRKVVPLLALSISLATAGNIGTYGHTFPVEEQNIIEFIKAKLQAMQESGKLAKLEEEFKDNVKKEVVTPAGNTLPTTDDPKSLRYYPIFTLQSDIRDSQGKLLYKKGTTVNPLDPKTYPKAAQGLIYKGYKTRLIFIDANDPRQLNFTLSKIKQFDESNTDYKIILINGNIDISSKYLRSRVYFDQMKQLATKFQLKHVPSIAYQKGDHFKIQEFAVHRYSNKLKRGNQNV